MQARVVLPVLEVVEVMAELAEMLCAGIVGNKGMTKPSVARVLDHNGQINRDSIILWIRVTRMQRQ